MYVRLVAASCFVVSCLPILSEGAGARDRSKARPNVVFLLSDDQRPDTIGALGNEHVRTPHLDGLASRGAVFENLFVQAPVCMGSRACLLTGRYLRACRMGSGSPLLDPREVTLAVTLQRAGSRTGTVSTP